MRQEGIVFTTDTRIGQDISGEYLTRNFDAVVHQISGTSHCNEYWYDSGNSEQRTWAEQVMELNETHPEYGMTTGPCPTEGYPVTCDPKYQPLEGGESLGTFKIVSHVTNIGWCSTGDDEEE